MANLRDKLEIPHLEQKYLQNRIKTLKANFAEVYDTFRTKLSGFNWSPITKTFSVEPKVWAELIEENDKAEKWRTQKFNKYDGLEELLAKDRATGDGAETAKEKLKKWANSFEKEITIDDIDKMVLQGEATLENYVNLDKSEELSTTKMTYETLENEITPKAKKKKVSNAYAEKEDGTIVLFSRAIETFNAGNEVIANALQNFQAPRSYSAEDIYNELLAMELDEQFLEILMTFF